MHNKWMILVAGITTVFVALIGLILLVNILKMIFGARKQKVRKELAPLPEIHSPAVTSKPGQARAGGEAKPSNDIVAAIVAAISAASGISPSQFRIASINPVGGTQDAAGSAGGFNTPVWGRVERFARK